MGKYLTAPDVAQIFTEEFAAMRAERGNLPPRGKPISVRTVWRYVAWSRPAKPGGKPHRYEGNPMPLPERINGKTMVWFPTAGEDLAGLERRLRAWYRDPDARPGHGAGGGPKPAGGQNHG